MSVSEGDSKIVLGFYFGSINLFSAFRKGNSYFLSHMSEDDYLTMLVHTSSNSIGSEVVPFTISDPDSVFSHIQMLLGMNYTDSEKERLKKYVAGPLDKEKSGKDALDRLVQDENCGYAFNIKINDQIVSLPVNCCAELIFREVRKLIYCADSIDVHESLVICIPQAYRAVQKRVLKEAAQLAGFPKVKLISDTDAAFTWCKDYLRPLTTDQNMKSQPQSKKKTANQYDKAICICCDHSFAGWSYYTWSNDREWVSNKRGCFQDLSLVHYIEKLTDTVTKDLWDSMDEEAKEGRNANEISPAVFFKICRLISNYIELHKEDTICIRFGKRGNQKTVSTTITQEEITKVLVEFGNKLKEELAKVINAGLLPGFESASLICTGECFLVKEVRDSIRELFKHTDDPSNHPYDMKIIPNNELAASACKCYENDTSFLFSSITVSPPPEKVKPTTVYAIGFLFKSIFGEGNKFQTLVEKGIPLPYSAKSKKYIFPNSRQETTLTFYEADDDQNGSTCSDYRPFKKYTIYRDEKHPALQKPPKPPREEDEEDYEYEYRYEHTLEYLKFKKDQKNNYFTIEYEISEDMKLTITSIKWNDGEPMAFDDLDKSKEEKARKNEERQLMASFFSMAGAQY